MPAPGHPVASWTEPPGGLLVWVVVLVELVTFAAGLMVFRYSMEGHEAEYALGWAALHERVALLNTVVLLTGGLAMVHCLNAIKASNWSRARIWLAGVMGLGTLFVVIKGWEYRDLLLADHAFGRDTFFTLYWLLTGFHLLHVVVALLLLLGTGSSLWVGPRSIGPAGLPNLEASAVFWHMCDLIWLMAYPTLYLLR